MDDKEKIIIELTELLFDYIQGKEKCSKRSIAIDTIGENLKMDGNLALNMLYKSLYEMERVSVNIGKDGQRL